MRSRLLLMCALPLLCGAFTAAHAGGMAPFEVPPESPPEGVPPFPVPPVVDPAVDAPPFGLPPHAPGFEPPAIPASISAGLTPAEIIVEVIHPRADELGLSGPMLSFSFEPGVAPPVVPEVVVPARSAGRRPVAAPEPGLLALLTLALLCVARERAKASLSCRSR